MPLLALELALLRAPAPFSPELAWLLALLRTALDGRAAPPPPALDWKKFAALVDRHRVGAWLHGALPAALAAHCPPEVAARFAEIATRNTHRALTLAAEQIRLARQLEAAGIEVIAVKGLVLAQGLYGRLGARHAGDLDLAVRVGEATRARDVFVAAGLRLAWPDFPLTPRQTQQFLRLKRDFEFTRESTDLRVELLWRFEGLPAALPVWETTVTITSAGHTFRTLAPELDALYNLQHGARHGWFRLFWLVDAALLLRDPRLDPAALVARARALGVERSLLAAAALAEELFDHVRPAALRPRPAEARLVAALTAEARRQLSRDLAGKSGVREWARESLYRVRLQKGLRAKYAMLSPHLFSPLSWRTLPLPDRWFFLYYPLTPFLWLWRRFGRTG
ncbi:MAG: hypothetical protein RLZZ15_4510 [Verrucomicrobiota bacterium]|jgi:hypothetical protein